MAEPAAEVCVDVEWEHIARGVPRDGNSCAIALALKEELGTEDVLVTGRDEVEIGGYFYVQASGGMVDADEFIFEFDSWSNKGYDERGFPQDTRPRNFLGIPVLPEHSKLEPATFCFELIDDIDEEEDDEADDV